MVFLIARCLGKVVGEVRHKHRNGDLLESCSSKNYQGRLRWQGRFAKTMHVKHVRLLGRGIGELSFNSGRRLLGKMFEGKTKRMRREREYLM